ncbi:hypothetical protein GMST_06320 [Geomonas silvestris]|uniref:Nitrate reductase molybdenum cofactor assembly chaperone n=1 Tax=Geomonas silvestris TaxID=2740184 RepID=A0A6V8MEC5_9BACT|nr:nitrate reductase molybdenum cofactor assembly chaperone [Geomonas silvestris]GFO58307.1 hypothetical protein GMST_06320 [Geomonas silvestris]
MSIQESYQALARLLDYPKGKQELTESYRLVASFFSEYGMAPPAAPFGELLEEASLAELQEEYVAQFDFNPAQAPYLGHHLYGDNQKKGAYLIRVKQQYRSFDFAPPENELPDHLRVLLAFLGHLAGLGEDTLRRQFIAHEVQPGLDKLIEATGARGLSPWLTLVEAAGLLVSHDCREVSTC